MKKTVTHEIFKGEECGERLDTKNCLTNQMISDHNQPWEVLKSDACDFLTSIKTGLKIHKSKKHYVIEQLGGNSSDTE